MPLHDATDYMTTVQESRDKLYVRPRAFVPAGAVQGANMAFRRAVLERIRGFDEQLGAGTRFPCEDIDAVAAVLWAGIPGVYDPRPVVYHDHGRKTEREAAELMRSYDEGRGAYYAKYILAPASKSKYIAAWMKSIARELAWTLRARRVPLMRQSLREILSGLRFALTEDGKRRI